MWLDRFPVGLSHDEVQYAANGLSYRHFGKDLSNYTFPESFFRTETEGRISAIPALIISFFSIFTEVNDFSLRILYFFVGLLSAVLLFKITEKLIHKKAAWCVFFVFLVNPWSFDLFRWVGDTAWALFFYLLGLYVFFKKTRGGVFLSIILFTLAYFSYYAARVIFLPLIFAIFIYGYFIVKDKKNLYVQLLIFGAITFLILILFDLHLPGSPVSGRSSDLVIFNKQYLTEQTNIGRRSSIINPMGSMFINKFTTGLGKMFDNYFSAFSTRTLFTSGDVRTTYTFSKHGLFYFSDIIFFGIGIFYLMTKSKKLFALILMLTIIAPLPTSLSIIETSVFNRSFLLLPIFTLIIGVGLYYAYTNSNIFVKIGLVILYVISISNFVYFYFYRFPIIQQENHYFSERILSEYLNRHKDQPVIIYIDQYRAMAMNYAFFSETNRLYRIGEIADQYVDNNGVIKINNIYFTNNCGYKPDFETVVFHRDSVCERPANNEYVVIQNQMDSGGVFYVYYDSMCDKKILTNYRRNSMISDYDFSKMNDDTFCNRWMNSI